MPMWVTVYAEGDINAVGPEQLRAWFEEADMLSLAEDYADLDDPEGPVDEAMAKLAFAPNGPGEFMIEFGYKRPVIVHLWTDPDRVAEELMEANEALSLPQSHPLRQKLARTKAVVGIEMGFSHTENMGIVFGYEAARVYAQHTNGLVHGDDDRWSVIVDWAWTPVRST